VESVYSVTIALLVLLVICLVIILFWLGRSAVNLKASVQAQKIEADAAIQELEQHLDIAMRLTQSFVDVKEEKEIINSLLSLVLEATNGLGASFVPLDDNNRPIAVIRQGEFPFPVPEAWLEYLATPAVRQGCANCANFADEGVKDPTCLLLRGPFSEGMGLYCFPLRQGEQELGMVNLYLPVKHHLDEQKHKFIKSLIQMTTMAIRGERLREREQITSYELRSVRNKQGLRSALQEVLENAKKYLLVDYALFIPDSSTEISWEQQFNDGSLLCTGDIHEGELSILEHEFRIESFRAKSYGEIVGGKRLDSTNSWFYAPIIVPNQNVQGMLVLVSKHMVEFTSRENSLFLLISQQLAEAISSAERMAGMEYRTIMEERQRLSREIHDGLAQTMGFLKLQLAQMISSLERNDQARLRQLMQTSYNALAEAYQDTRRAIDGLRISPQGKDGYQLGTWLNQTVDDYQTQSFKITIETLDVRGDLPPEVHAQLIRIVQEALSNIRKHAQVNEAFISVIQRDKDLILEVRDNGTGFSPGDVPNLSRYGLQVMRERAELMGADFQVISKPKEGTTVRVRLPLDTRF
jgi:two-component system, NarL family, nitrate/nitrite sensor histidine kinase NarX